MELGLAMGRCRFVCALLTALVLLVPAVSAAEPFPFERDLLLDVTPMRGAKRVPILAVAPDGNATVDLWCRTVPGRLDLSGASARLTLGPLPEGPPAMQSAGQCTPDRMRADEDLYIALVQVGGWRLSGSTITFDGPEPLRFRFSDH